MPVRWLHLTLPVQGLEGRQRRCNMPPFSLGLRLDGKLPQPFSFESARVLVESHPQKLWVQRPEPFWGHVPAECILFTTPIQISEVQSTIPSDKQGGFKAGRDLLRLYLHLRAGLADLSLRGQAWT